MRWTVTRLWSSLAKDARLQPSDTLIGECEYSEAGIIRMIYRMSVDENLSRIAIATHLNALGIPPAHACDQRSIMRGKRLCRTSGRWTPGRIRNMLVNTTYKGIHYYGRRSKKTREVIAQLVPALVDESTWEQAQRVLHAHQVFSRRNAKRNYLLRGLIKCGLCGLTYCGSAYNVKSCPYYYKCNGRHKSGQTF
ncbi:recombinase family protein [Ktedonospora formicarum]|uniref:recombinase family protein n=1 Tax=Ktedonospora formicarum TaxID=2778364 RepID=UPI0022A7F240|nr:recombinase family protein [Ktedonospora formicarum]